MVDNKTETDVDTKKTENICLEERFQYSLLNDGNVIINKYISKEVVDVLVIPSSIYIEDYDNDPFNNNKTVLYIAEYAFDNTPWLLEQTSEMVVIGNVLLRYNGSSKELVIPEGIYMIGINAYNSDTIEK